MRLGAPRKWHLASISSKILLFLVFALLLPLHSFLYLPFPLSFIHGMPLEWSCKDSSFKSCKRNTYPQNLLTTFSSSPILTFHICFHHFSSLRPSFRPCVLCSPSPDTSSRANACTARVEQTEDAEFCNGLLPEVLSNGDFA